MKLKLVQRIALVGFCMLVLLGMALPALAQPSPILVINTGYLNLRVGPGPQYGIVTSLAGGTEVAVLGRNVDGSWYLVQSSAGQGWVDIDFTIPRGDFRNVPVINYGGVPTTNTSAQPAATASTTTTSSSPTRLVAALNVLSVNLRPGPYEASGLIRTLYKDDNVQFPILGFQYDNLGIRWVNISVPSVGSGWIEASKIKTFPAPASSTTTTTTHTTTSTASMTSGVSVPSAANAVVNTSYLNVRNGPGGQYSVLATLPGGTTLPIIGITADGSWVLVRGAFGQGWLDTDFVLIRGAGADIPIIRNVY